MDTVQSCMDVLTDCRESMEGAVSRAIFKLPLKGKAGRETPERSFYAAPAPRPEQPENRKPQDVNQRPVSWGGLSGNLQKQL